MANWVDYCERHIVLNFKHHKRIFIRAADSIEDRHLPIIDRQVYVPLSTALSVLSISLEESELSDALTDIESFSWSEFSSHFSLVSRFLGFFACFNSFHSRICFLRSISIVSTSPSNCIRSCSSYRFRVSSSSCRICASDCFFRIIISSFRTR